MNVTLISQYFPPERGAVRYGQHLARGLAARGHQVKVIAGLPHHPTGKPHPEYGRFVPKIRVEDSTRVIRTPLVMGSNRQNIRRVLGFVSFSFSAFLWAVFGKRPDTVIASVPPATSAVSGLLAAWLRRRPFVVILRDIEPWRALTMRGWDHGAPGRALIGFFMWIYRRARRVVVMHEREVEYLVDQGIAPDRISVIPHGVDSEQLQGETHTAPTIPRRPGRHVFVYAGTVGLVHGVPAFLEAMADPRIRELPIDIVIIGDGQYRSECERLVRAHQLHNVTILPAIPHDQVPGALAQADVLVCTFRNDDDIPLCSKLYEYCAAGKPILVYGTNIAADLVAQIGNGLGCPAGDTDSLFGVLSEFVANADTWRARGLKGRAYAQEHFAQSLRDDQWEEMLSGNVQRAGGA